MANIMPSTLLSNEAILSTLGERLTQWRLEYGLTQAQLAQEAGVAKRTVERVESGESIQLLTLVRLCRVLGLMDGLNQLVPEQAASPMAILKDKSLHKQPKRIRAGKQTSLMNVSKQPVWQWGDDA